MVTASSSSSLKEYLKRYESNNIDEDKRKKKKKKKPRADATGVVVVDEDPVWQKQVKIDEEENDSADEEKPQIDEDIEVRRMKRLEELRARRPFGVISEDGSGWVPVSETLNSSNAGDQESDMSPPRRSTINSSNANSDLSPQHRRRARNDTPEPEHQPSSKADADLSPPRKRRARNDTPEPDQRPFSKADADLSPPRKQRARNDTPSPQHKPKASSTSAGDLSPPRQRRKRYESPSPEPESKFSRSLDMPDISASSRTVRDLPYRDDSGASPAADLSPPRKSRKDRLPQSHHSVSGNDAGISDLSPPRRRQKESSVPKQQPKTGLVTGRDVKEEVTRAKMDEWSRFKEMDPSVSGRGAEGVYRDKKTGKRMSKEEFLNSQKKVKDEKPKEIKLEWGKGLAQKREAESKLKELELEKEKPFARTRDDPELDRMMKDRPRWGDPMLHLVKKKSLEPVLADLGDNEKVKESGFIIPQEIPNHSWIKRGLDAPPNRYGIRPGRHWDGVDRSNGTEKGFFKRKNEQQATEKEAYLWSVADM